MPEYRLSFPIDVGDPSKIKVTADFARQLAKETNLSAESWKVFSAETQRGVAAGNDISKVLRTIQSDFKNTGTGISEYTKLLRQSIAEEERAAAVAVKASKEKERAVQSAARAARQAQSETQ